MSSSSDPTAADPFAVALDTQGLRRQSVYGSLFTVVSQSAKMVIQLGSQLMLARLLLPADFGLLAMVGPVIGFILVFSDIGLGQAIVQRPVLKQDQVSALFWVSLMLSCGLAIVVGLVSPLVAWLYGDVRVVALMIALAVVIPVSALGINPTALLSRRMRFGAMACIEVAATLAGVATSVLCARQGWSYWSLVAGQFVNTATGSALAWGLCGWLPSHPRFVDAAWADLKFGGNLTGANLATFVITSGDNIIVGMMTGSVALGFYDRSYRLVVGPLGQMLAPISRVALPLLSRIVDRPDAYRTAYLKMFRALLLVTVPGMLVCITSGPTLIHLLLGDRWRDAAPIFSWICVGGLTSGIYSSAGWLFISQGRTREMKDFTIAVSFINIATFLLGAFVWGIVGVAAAGALGFVLLTTPLMLYGATRSGPVRNLDVMGCVCSFAARGALVCMTLVWIDRHFANDLARVSVAAVFAYAACFALALLDPGERQLLRDAIGLLQPLRRTPKTTFSGGL